MMEKYFIVALIALFVSFVLALFLRHKNKDEMTMRQLVRDEHPSGERFIVTTGMTEAEVERAISDFIDIHVREGEPIERPDIVRRSGSLIIRLANDMDYALFCYWVNYVVYSNKDKRYNNHVTAWYDVPSDAVGSWKMFAGQRLMFFIPDDDNEYDNVWFVTRDNHCYKQEFAMRAVLVPQERSPRPYSTFRP